MTQTIAPFVRTPECTPVEARAMCEAIHAAEGTQHMLSAGPTAGDWFTTLENLLASPLGQAALSLVEGFVSRGLLKPAPAPAPQPH